jgi:hypothetical protein
MLKIDRDQFIETCNNSKTMAIASSELGLHFNTFKRYAEKLGCYNPNKGGKGTKKPWKLSEIKTQDIIDGEYPSYHTFKLKNRLLKEGIKENKCEECGLPGSWNGKPISIELDHIDGKRTNHRIENLRMLCPNCHSQTDTYRSKNKK